MTRLAVRIATALTTFALLAPAAARADLPPANNSTFPAFIRLVGSKAGVPDVAGGHFAVVVRDLANNPVPNSAVIVDLSGCADIRLAVDQLDPALVVNCSQRTVTGHTNAAGVADFTVLGDSFGPAVSGANCAKLYADGVLLGSVTVAAFDLDGAQGVSIGDLSVWLADLGTLTYRGRDDFDGNGLVSVGDLSVWLGALGGGRSTTTGATCP